MSDTERFLRQNETFAADLTEEDVATVQLYAEHHAGGLYVLWRDLEDGLSVKTHDSWGGDTDIVVHIYDAEDPDLQRERYFTSGHEALACFLSATTDDLTDPEWED